MAVYKVSEYVQTMLSDQMQTFQAGSKSKTGYKNIDLMTSLYPGLYILGAISSLGKTTFAHQMADQISASGTPVLFFSLEQSALELVSKSLARIYRSQNKADPLTSLQIRKLAKDDQRLVLAIEEYKKTAENLYIVECDDFSVDIDKITQISEEYIKKTGKTPVVIVDYLQVIQLPDNYKTTKDGIDIILKKLRALSRKNNMVVLAISSLNRMNYLTELDFESFKESGGIEYTADVLWGLQLSAIHDDIFNQANKINEKRQKIKDAKAKTPRSVELICLKNRYGVSSYTCTFDYFPNFDLFVPTFNNPDAADQLEADPDGFVKIPEELCPFAS